MSRIGRLPIAIPQGVEVTLDGNTVTVKKGKNVLVKSFDKRMGIEINDGHVHVTRPNDTKAVKALHGLTRVLIANMIKGVNEGYKKTLVLNGVSYKAVQKGNGVSLFVGYSHPIDIMAPEGVTITVKSATEVEVSGADKEAVGQTAANIKAVRIPDPYHLYGIRYSDEVLVKKVGKSAAK